MGRKSKNRSLILWMNGEIVARWEISAQGIHSLYYEESWLDSINSRPISLSLPLQPPKQAHKGNIVEYYFDNLLPDSVEIKRRIQNRFGINSIKPFELLEEIGRDCVGAIQFLKEGETSKEVLPPKGRKVSTSDVENILANVKFSNSMFNMDKDEFRISIAGAQEKTALNFNGYDWLVPYGSTPTTHILKLPIGPLSIIDMSTSVENEWLCSRIINGFGIPCAKTEIQQFGKQKCLVVQRFDRRIINNLIYRIPQEDMCQATGTSPGNKYEADGGPGIFAIMKLLLGSENMEHNRYLFFKTQILFWLLGAIEGHAKNFSIFINSGGSYTLTPVYDVLSAYPVMGKGTNKIPIQKLRMAMAVTGKNRHYLWSNISRSHWIGTGTAAGLNKKIILSIIDEIIEISQSIFDNIYNNIPSDIYKVVGKSIKDKFFKALNILKE